MNNHITALDIGNDTQKNHIREHEQFVILLSQALTQNDTEGLSTLGSLSKNNEESNLIQQFV